MKRQIALFYLVGHELFPSNSVLASPIVSSSGTSILNSHNGPGSKLSFLIAATILGSSVTLLLVAKWIYLSRQYRKTGNVSRKARLSSRPLWNASFSAPRQRPFPTFSEELLSRKGKSGLLVGLFGSPSWETRCSNIIDAMSEQLSFTRITGTSPSPRCHSSYQYSNDSSFYADNTSGEGKSALALSDRLLQAMHDTSRLSCEMPAFPLALVLKDKLDGRHDPPTQSSLCVTGGSSNTNRLSLDRSFINIPESTHRPSQGTYITKSFNQEPLSSCYGGLGLPNPSIPNSRALSSSEDVDDPASEHESNPNPPPYDTPYIPQPPLGTLEDCFEDCGSRCSFPFTTGKRAPGDGVVDSRRSFRRSSDADEVIAADCEHTAASETAKIKSKTSTLQHAQMRSPKLGPSPLRSMFLPWNEENHGGTHNANVGSGSIFPRSLLNVNDIGIHHEHDAYGPVAKLLPVRDGRKSHSQKFRYSCNARIRKNSDSDQIFGLIQELVQESKAWDDSLFVNHKFKAMIDGSNLTSYVSTNTRKKRRRSCRPLYPFYGLLEDIPEVEAEMTPAEIRDEKLQKKARNSRQLLSGEEPPHSSIGTTR
ncbi:hypothetical protein HYPSUDRAFT_32377 [Hypholoma sublateritium FD-334 SS-4]|uniref:Uncharacterized protein n=1 Tax=Hypholoma sublateritium (strain FD-334 SS-4) TaxID=945553 RepID=A0A0D2LQ62_HYPSF|nr:hypothetical protein HYPSUDRAFT_32377 [Hypholoma sublateritium FD-334 SS-4]